MRKKKNALYLLMIIVFLLVDMLFFWNSIQDVMFVSHIQETTGTIIRIEEQTHDWNIGKRCEFSYTVDGIHYRGTFTSYSIGALSDISLGKQIVVSYSAENPSNVKQGSVVRNIGIIVLKCSAYILCNMIILIGWILRATCFYRNNVFLSTFCKKISLDSKHSCI